MPWPHELTTISPPDAPAADRESRAEATCRVSSAADRLRRAGEHDRRSAGARGGGTSDAGGSRCGRADKFATADALRGARRSRADAQGGGGRESTTGGELEHTNHAARDG